MKMVSHTELGMNKKTKKKSELNLFLCEATFALFASFARVPNLPLLKGWLVLFSRRSEERKKVSRR